MIELGWFRKLGSGALAVSSAAAFLFACAVAFDTHAVAASSQPIDDLIAELEWRNVGPKRGGRSIAVGGSASRPNEAYFGATGGGLWKTTDAGVNWSPITDGQIKSSSVGAIAVAPSDPDIVYIGMGEGQLRSNVMQGDGVYKSTDGGKTWAHVGLEKTKTITTIRVDPVDPDRVFVAALGDPFKPNIERGIYRSEDGGRTWRRILFRSDRAGAIDLTVDPRNPKRMFASLWEVYRKPWKLWSGGDGSGLFETVDGGNTWTEITDRPGLPQGPLGKMTIAISPADPSRVYANIEATKGGLYRSDDGGKSWTHINGARKLWQRSFYFMQVRPDPKDRDTVYVLSFKLEKSIDGGRTFAHVPTQHADIHDLWIDPTNTARLIVADDGGGSVSVNGGATWTEQDYPTAQIYRLETTNDFPYHICGAQQDNTTVCVASRTRATAGVRAKDRYSDYYTVGFSEMGYVAAHPRKEGVFFVGATNSLTRFDRSSENSREVHPYPYYVMGQSAASMKERWNWTFPVVFSDLAPFALYAGSQRLWRSVNEGKSWEPISPDLTFADPKTLGDTGGEILLDQDGPEVFATLHTVSPSPLNRDLIWTGSDDGLIHITTNNGMDWANITPQSLPALSKVSFIDASPHKVDSAYVAVKRHELGDRTPYLYKLTRYGQSAEKLQTDFGAGNFIHAVREDPLQEGMVYVGTEHGVFVSLDAGKSWKSLSSNLPDVHVSGIDVHGDELVISTHGRSFYVMEGLNLLRQFARDKAQTSFRFISGAEPIRRVLPATFALWVHKAFEGASLEIVDQEDRVIRTLFKDRDLPAGASIFRWDLHYDGATIFPGMILESPNPARGPIAAPGRYAARLRVGQQIVSVPVRVKNDPRLEGQVSQRDLERQLDAALQARDATDAANKAVIDIRRIKRGLSIADICQRAELASCQKLTNALAQIEGKLYQVKNESPKDKIAYPIQLNDRLAGILGTFTYSDGPPTDSQLLVLDELTGELNSLMSEYGEVMSEHSRLMDKVGLN